MKPLVLVHGFMGGSAQWAGQVAGLAPRPVIAVDLPGFGANADAPVINSVRGFAEWVVGHLRALGVTEYDLLGHSMGGMIVQDMTRLDGAAIDRLILYGTGAVGVLPGRFETIAQSKERAVQDGAVATARRIAATWFLEREQAAGYPDCAELAARSSAAAIAAGLDAMEGWSGVDGLEGISHAPLVLWGDGDRTYAWPQVEQLWTKIPGARLAVVPHCAHAVHLEKPAIFNELIADFLPS